MSLISDLFARRPPYAGRHLQRAARAVPAICGDCDRGYHHSADPGGWCQCPCAADTVQRARPSWRERLTTRADVVAWPWRVAVWGAGGADHPWDFRHTPTGAEPDDRSWPPEHTPGRLAAWWGRQFYDPREVMPLAAQEPESSRPLVNVPRPAAEPGWHLARSPGPGHPDMQAPTRGDDQGWVSGRRGLDDPAGGHSLQSDSLSPRTHGGTPARATARRVSACPNCGRPGFDGAVCGRCAWGYGYQPAHEAAVAAVWAPGSCGCIIGNGHGCVTVSVQDCRVHGTLPPEHDDTDIISKVRVCAGREPRQTAWVMVRPDARIPCHDMPRPLPAHTSTGPGQPRETPWQRYARTGVPDTLRYVAEILAAPLPQVKALTTA